jgi:outer membrane autotransporter protein
MEKKPQMHGISVLFFVLSTTSLQKPIIILKERVMISRAFSSFTSERTSDAFQHRTGGLSGRFKKHRAVFAFFVFAFFFIGACHAATLRFSPTPEDISEGSSAVGTVRLDDAADLIAAGTTAVRIDLLIVDSSNFAEFADQVPNDFNFEIATLGQDFNVSVSSVVLTASGGFFNTASIPVSIVDDNLQENQEAFGIAELTLTDVETNTVLVEDVDFVIDEDAIAVVYVIEADDGLSVNPKNLNLILEPGSTVSRSISVSGGLPPYSISLEADDDADGSVSDTGLSADGSFTYSFTLSDNATTPSFGDTIRVEDANGDVALVNVSNFNEPFPTMVLDENEQNTANAIINANSALLALRDETGSLSNGQADLLNLTNELINSSAGNSTEALNALQEITPEESGVSVDVANEAAETQLGNITTRLSTLRAGAGAGIDVSGLNVQLAGATIPGMFFNALASESIDDAGKGYYESEAFLGGRLGLFINGNVAFGDRDAADNQEGFDFTTGGVTGGVDYKFTPNFILGMAFGYTSTDADYDDDGELNIDAFTGSLYANWYPMDELYIDGIISYGSSRYEADRRITYNLGTPVDREVDSEFDGNQITIGISTGYNFQYGSLGFGPVASVNYIRTKIDDYEERSTSSDSSLSGLDLAFEEQQTQSVTTRLGLRGDYSVNLGFGVFLPKLEASWEHEYSEAGDDITVRFVNDPSGEPFTVVSEDPDRDYFLISPGFSLILPGGVSTFFSYEYTLDRDDLNQHRFDAGIRLELW